jgi:putative mRNA 3-end processing factor
MQITQKKGLAIKKNTTIHIDALSGKQKKIIISHAHKDHANPNNQNEYYTTPETAELINPNTQQKNFHHKNYKKNFHINEFEVELHPSGHILGSAQTKITNNTTTVITSDYKPEKTFLPHTAKPLHADTLIIESTFGTPEYTFPPREKTYEEIIEWTNKNIAKNHFLIFGGHATGKAQELTFILSRLCNEKPLVTKKIFEQNKTYEKFEINLGKYTKLNHNLKESNTLIVPPALLGHELTTLIKQKTGKNTLTAIASGWKTREHKHFPLSDHADYNQLIQYAQETKPKKIFTYHGHEKQLAYHLKKLGFNAKPLTNTTQCDLNDF